MRVDVHTHIFPDEVREKRTKFVSMDPSFAIIYGDECARMIGGEGLITAMEGDGVDVSVVFGFPWRDIGICREHNDYVADICRMFPGRLIGFVCLPPGGGRDVVRELERCLDRGLRGAGELAYYDLPSGGDSFVPEGVIGVLKERDLPLLLHVTEPVGHEYPGKSWTDLKALYAWILRNQDLDIILAHWGGGLLFYELMPEVKRACRRVYYDTAAGPFLYRRDIYRIALRVVGVERILFGSDYPLIPPSRYFREMKEGGLSREEMILIQGGNASRLLGLN